MHTNGTILAILIRKIKPEHIRQLGLNAKADLILFPTHLRSMSLLQDATEELLAVSVIVTEYGNELP